MYGGGKRNKDIATVLRQRNPDVIVLGEYQSGTSDRLINPDYSRDEAPLE